MGDAVFDDDLLRVVLVHLVELVGPDPVVLDRVLADASVPISDPPTAFARISRLPTPSGDDLGPADRVQRDIRTRRQGAGSIAAR
jgi:hypothetical protein